MNGWGLIWQFASGERRDRFASAPGQYAPQYGSYRAWAVGQNGHTSFHSRFDSDDADARIAKMKDGTTHLAHKAEHAVDMKTGAAIAVTLQAADQGDTTTIQETLAETAEQVAYLIEREADKRPDAEPQVSRKPLTEIVADKGYHSSETMLVFRPN